MQSLIDFRYQPRYAAADGDPGRGNDCNGRKGEDLILKVPVGTTIRDAESGELLADLVEKDTRILFLRGGKGGMGNMNFATPTRQAPDYAQPGLLGETRKVRLELKLLADVGLVGYPNAGKSTLISKVTSAKPKIADYPFTTLVPNLGVVRAKSMDFVMADIPGIIEGAADGKGLGVKFLKHIDRTRLLLVMLDLDPNTGRQLDDELKVLLQEMSKFSESLNEKPKLLVLTKSDAFALELNQDNPLNSEFLKERGYNEMLKILKAQPTIEPTPFMISAVSGVGLDTLKEAIESRLQSMGPRIVENTLGKEIVWGNRELL